MKANSMSLRLPLDLLVMLKLLSLGDTPMSQLRIALSLGLSPSAVNRSLHRLVHSRLANGHYEHARLVKVDLIIEACAEFLSVIKYCMWFESSNASLWDDKYHRADPMEYTQDFQYLCAIVSLLICEGMAPNCGRVEDIREMLKVELEAIYR
jgi:predicted transcriptional regulator